MAYSKERKAKQMIAKLEKQLKPSAGRVVSSAEQRRIKNRISSLRQSVSTMSAAKGKPAAKTKKANPEAAKPSAAKSETTEERIVRRRDEYNKRKARIAKNKAAHTPSAKDKANAAKAAKKSAARKETSAQKTERRRREYNERKKRLQGTSSPSGGWMKKFFDFK